MIARLLAALAATLGLAGVAHANDNDLRSVAAMANHNRVLLVFAPSLRDPRLIAQQADMAKFAVGAAERDLLLVQVADHHVLGAHDKSATLRRRFKVNARDYRAFLIGKDGNVALSQAGPIPADTLRTAIDAMPMRQAEVERARKGLGKSGS